VLWRASQSVRRPGLTYRRIVVPLVAGSESQTAVSLAAKLASDQGASITAVVVIELPAELPLDAHMREEEAQARRVLEEARAIAGSYGVRVRARVVRARQPGEAIVAEAEALQADLVVLRASAGKRPGRGATPFGKTVDYVLKHASCRVLVDAHSGRG
jgi:nucleotide-binding universal stress UspA family protein